MTIAGLEGGLDGMARILAATARTERIVGLDAAFQQRGYEFHCLQDASAALEHADTNMPDCVLYDFHCELIGRDRFVSQWIERFPAATTPILAIADASRPHPSGSLCEHLTGFVYPELGFDSVYAAVSLAVETQRLRARLVEMGKLALLGEIMAGVLHELKNPINNMLGGLERLTQRVETDPAVARWAEIIRRNGELLRESVGSLLAGFRGQLPDQPVDVHAVLDKATHYALKGDLSARDISVQRELAATNATVVASPGPLLHLFLNLVVNARQAIGPNPGLITLRSANDKDTLRIEVQDNGPGIDPAIASRLFQRFQTTKRAGSGVGLMLVKSIAEQVGGCVTAENAPTGGAIFRVELPIRKCDSAESVSSASTSSASSKS